jgi:myosin heavy subunit
MLSASDRHYVRCIKPNETKSDQVFDTEKVRLQLLCNGIFETVAIRKAGFSMRLPFERFFDKYWAILDHRSSEGIEDLLNKLMPDTNQWCLGKQKVFLREPTVELLSNTLTKKWEKNAIPIQKHIRSYNIQVYYITQCAIRSVQSHIRKHRAILRLQELRDIYNAATCIQSYVSRLRAYEEYLVLKRAWEERVTTKVQAHIRKYTAVLLLQELRDMYNAATCIQSYVSRLRAFEEYLELKRAWEERVRCTIILQKYIRKSKAGRMLSELQSRQKRANLRASQFKDYYDCTRININPGLKLNTSILQQPWAQPMADDQDDVIVVVYTPRH